MRGSEKKKVKGGEGGEGLCRWRDSCACMYVPSCVLSGVQLTRLPVQSVVPRLVRAMRRKATDALAMKQVNKEAREAHFNSWQRALNAAAASRRVPAKSAVLLKAKNQFMNAFSAKVCACVI